jgi:uncharacterized protein
MSRDPRFDGPGPDETWHAAMAEGRFIIQRCMRCGVHRFPPALVCAACGAPELAWIEASGRGTVHSSTTVRDKAGDYNVALVDLAEGPRMMSRIEDVAPQDVCIGLAVVMRIAADPEPCIVFAPAEGGRA